MTDDAATRPTVQRMWQEFRSATNSQAQLAGAFAFGDSPEMADELAALVRHGPKRATAGLLAGMERDGDPVPRPGDYWVVLGGSGEPVCVIQTTEVQIKPLYEADDAFAWDEGEGDRSLVYWRAAHDAFFRRECEALGVPFRDDLLVVFERFNLVWPTDPRPTDPRPTDPQAN